jgi:hypothetical protein
VANREALPPTDGLDRPPPTCTYLTVDEALDLSNPVRATHLEVRMQVPDPKPTNVQIIAILRDGLGQLRERHGLPFDIGLSVADEQRIAAGVEGQLRPSFTEVTSTRGVWVILLSLPAPLACGRTNAHHTNAIAHYEDLEVSLSLKVDLPPATALPRTGANPPHPRVQTFADLDKGDQTPAPDSFSHAVSRGGKPKTLPVSTAMPVHPSLRRPVNSKTNRSSAAEQMVRFRITITPGLPRDAFCLAQIPPIPNDLPWQEAQDDFMARVRDGLTRHLSQVSRASDMLAEVVHLRFGRIQDARTSKQIIQLWVAAPEKDAFYFLTQIQALHGVTQIVNSLRYMWVVSKESRKLQSPLFDPQMMVRPNIQVHSGFASLASYWIRLDRATRRISQGQVLDCMNSFYVEHGVQVPTIIDVLVLQSNAMAAEPSFLLCMASLKSLAQLASDLQPRGLLRVKLGMDFLLQLGHPLTAAIQQEVVSLKSQAPATAQQRQAFGDAARRVSSPKRQRSDSITMDGAEAPDQVRPVTFEIPAVLPGPEVTPPRQPAQNADLVAGQGVNPSALTADPTQELMDLDEETASSRGTEVDENATQDTEHDHPEGLRDLSQPDQLASNFPAKPHACAITAIAVSVIATTVPFLLTNQRMEDLLQDPTVQDLVSHSLEQTIKDDTFNCPGHLGVQVMSAWKAVLDADGGPPPPEAMLPLHVVIPFLPPGAILLFPREGERGFWIEMVPIGGPLLPGDVATAFEMSPILVVYTATSQEGVAHLDTISKLDWEVRSRLVHQVIENPEAFEQGTVASIPSEEMHSWCGSSSPRLSHQETQTDLTGAVVSAPDVIMCKNQLVSRYPYPKYACGLVAVAKEILHKAECLTEERARRCLDDEASGYRVDSWLENTFIEAEKKDDFEKVKRTRRLLNAWGPMLPLVKAGLPLSPLAMVMFKDVLALAPRGSLLLRLQETEGKLWVELTDIKGSLQECDISSALEDAPLIYVETMTEDSESIHLETLTPWDAEVRDLLVQQAEVRAGFFRTSTKLMIGAARLGTPCGDRKHFPSVPLLGISQDEKSILQLPVLLTEVLVDSAEPCDGVTALTWYPPELDEPTEPPQVHRQEVGEVGLLGSSWRWLSSGVQSAYAWWNPREVTEDPGLCPNSMPHEPLAAVVSGPPRLREAPGPTTGDSRGDRSAEPTGAVYAALRQGIEDKRGPVDLSLYSSMIAMRQAETVSECSTGSLESGELAGS